MSAPTAPTGLTELGGLRLADAIDLRFGRALCAFLDRRSEASAEPSEDQKDARAKRNPKIVSEHIPDIDKRLAAFRWSRVAREGVVDFESVDTTPYTPLCREAQLVFEAVARELPPQLIFEAVRPIAVALFHGSMAANGINEAHGLTRVAIPKEFFEIGRYAIIRNGSRLVTLDRLTGREGEPSYSAVILVSVPAASTSDVDAQRGPGRPTRESAIEAAIRKLDAEGLISPKMVKSSIYPKIRNLCGGGAGLGNETLRLAITDYLNRREISGTG